MTETCGGCRCRGLVGASLAYFSFVKLIAKVGDWEFLLLALL
jgi:hypothetical protein